MEVNGKMHAMILDDKLNFVWAEVPDPVRKEGEVLIQVHAAAVNRADLMQKDGCYASPPDWPQWCGLEVSGEVLEAPADAAVKPGDKVCALLGGGGYSERVTVPAGMVIPIPEGLSMIEAASLPEVWCTVYLNLQLEAGGMKKGDVFYMQAGASGVGLAAIQYAKHLGAEVITTIDSPVKAEFVRKLGADYVLDYRTAQFFRRFTRISGRCSPHGSSLPISMRFSRSARWSRRTACCDGLRISERSC